MRTPIKFHINVLNKFRETSQNTVFLIDYNTPRINIQLITCGQQATTIYGFQLNIVFNSNVAHKFYDPKQYK